MSWANTYIVVLNELEEFKRILADIYLVVYFIKIILSGFKGLEARLDWIENLVVYQSASEK